jgi:ketosteroid isomerase-like protein
MPHGHHVPAVLTRGRSFAVAALLLAAVVATACAPRVASGGDAGRAQLEERQAAFLAAMTARDAAAIGAMFAEDAVLHVAGRPPVIGAAAIQQFYAGMFNFLAGSSATVQTVRVASSGDMAWSQGSTVNEFRRPEGSVSYAGKFLLVWQRVAGDWRIVAYGISSDDG